MDELNKIIIGRPTLQSWNYHLNNEGGIHPDQQPKISYSFT